MSFLKDRNLQVILLISLIAVSGNTLLSAFLSEMVDPLGASGPSIGLVISALTLPGIGLSPAIGVLVDKLGRKKVLIPSLILFGGAGSLASSASSFEVMLVLRFVQGLGWSALIAITAVLIGDLYSDQQRAAAIGINSGVLSLGSMLYPSIGGILALISWRIPFLVFSIAIPVALIAALFLKEKPNEGRLKSVNDSGFWMLIRQPRMMIAMGGGFLAFVLYYGGLIAYLGFLLQGKFGISSDIRGIYLSLVMLMIILTSLQIGRMVEKVSKQRLILLGFGFQGIALLLLPFPSTAELMIPMLALFGVGRGIASPVLSTYILDSASEEIRGRVYFSYQVPVKLGQTTGPIIAGMVFGLVSIDAIYWLLGGATLLIVLIISMVTTVQSR